MDTTKTRSFFCEIWNLYSKRFSLSVPFSLNLASHGYLLLSILAVAFLVSGCKTIPINDRNFSERGGFWEQDENTDSRFHHTAKNDRAAIGTLYASGKNALLDGAQVAVTERVTNNAFVSTGSQSSARIEFKVSDSSCLIRVDEIIAGNAYADTSDCQQNIETLHAKIEAKNAILHIHVSQHQTEITVISGVIKVMLRGNAAQSIDVRSDREIVITQDTIGRPYSIMPDEIWQRIRWRDDFPLYREVVDWETVIASVVVGIITVGTIAAVILLSKGHGGRNVGFPRHH